MSSLANMQAGTRVNAEQASRRAMREPTLLLKGEGRWRSGKKSDISTEPFPPGYWRWHAWKREDVATREALSVARTRQPEPREGQAGPAGWRTGPYD